MMVGLLENQTQVNCRIGSLEIFSLNLRACPFVNCRIGSLEILKLVMIMVKTVNCRIGSLEKRIYC